MRRRQIVFDIALAVLMTSVGLLTAYVPDPLDLWRDPDLRGQLLILALNAPLALRRVFPLAVLLTTCSIAMYYQLLDYYHPVTSFAVGLAVFSVAAHRPRRVSVPAAVAGMATLVFGQDTTEPGMEAYGAAIVFVLTLVAWAFGDNTRLLAERGERLAALSERLRREQEEKAHRAVAHAQRRIARELHDVVAHHMSVISVQAGLGRYVLESDVDTARSSLQVIGDTAHEALSEMRRLLAVMRVSADSDAPYDAAPGLGRLDELLERVRAAGASVELRAEGTARALPPGLGLCAYRVVQESLTNVLKHADPPAATVKLEWRPHDVRVTVTNKGAPVDVPVEEGHGLIGMRERARIYGGTLEAGPCARGGFVVTLILPTRERDA